jgi:hypothetical protein
VLSVVGILVCCCMSGFVVNRLRLHGRFEREKTPLEWAATAQRPHFDSNVYAEYELEDAELVAETLSQRKARREEQLVDAEVASVVALPEKKRVVRSTSASPGTSPEGSPNDGSPSRPRRFEVATPLSPSRPTSAVTQKDATAVVTSRGSPSSLQRGRSPMSGERRPPSPAELSGKAGVRSLVSNLSSQAPRTASSSRALSSSRAAIGASARASPTAPRTTSKRSVSTLPRYSAEPAVSMSANRRAIPTPRTPGFASPQDVFGATREMRVETPARVKTSARASPVTFEI